MATKKKLDFEQSMVRLEEIVGLLERGDAPLEQAMTLFEEGAGILRQCSALLDQAEQKVTLLTAGPDGQPEEQPLRRGALSMEQEVFQQRLEEDRKLVEEALHPGLSGLEAVCRPDRGHGVLPAGGREADPPRSGAGDLPPVRRRPGPGRCPWPAVWR